jgi:DNA-directed RNA polymerase subunit RPC12/RpoP
MTGHPTSCQILHNGRSLMETLMVRCAACGRAFATTLQVDRASLEAMVLNERYRCPHCGVAASFTKADHFHRLIVSDGPPP